MDCCVFFWLEVKVKKKIVKEKVFLVDLVVVYVCYYSNLVE